jgi:hypothetical protein
MGMTRFWEYQVRYRLARRLIYAGIFVMPEGRYKDNLVNSLWSLYDEVMASAFTNGEL